MMMGRSDISGEATHVPLVVLSLPEVDSLCTRAARGAGYSWGLAEECGQAMSWCAAHGLDWAPILLRRLGGERGDDVMPGPAIWTADGPVCALQAGVTMTDFAALPEGPGGEGIEIGRVFEPALILPFAVRAAGITGRTLSVHLDGTALAHVSDHGFELVAPDLINTVEATVSVCPVARPEPVITQEPVQTAAIAPEHYAALSDIALRMTVPSTAESQTRAGGEGSDND